MWNLQHIFSYEDKDIGRFSNFHYCTFNNEGVYISWNGRQQSQARDSLVLWTAVLSSCLGSFFLILKAFIVPLGYW